MGEARSPSTHGVVYHMYSCYDRGTDGLDGTWQLLDRAPLGWSRVVGWPPRRADHVPR